MNGDNKNSNIVFRRIRGRIIPIRKNKESKAPAIASVASGVAIGAASGKLETEVRRGIGKFTTASEKLTHASDVISKKAVKIFYDGPEQLDMFDADKYARRRFKAQSKAYGYAKKGVNYKRAANILSKVRPNIKGGGILFAGSLISGGVAALVSEKNDSKTEEVLKNFGAAAATGAFLLGTGKFGVGLKASRILKKIKSFRK